MQSLVVQQHHTLISLLKTLYLLLSDLQYIKPECVILPPHDPALVNQTAALDAGFTSDQMLSLLTQIPNLRDRDFFLAYETRPMTYVDDEANQPEWKTSGSAFNHARDPTCCERTDLMPPTMLPLTWADNYGWTILYDLDTKRVREWNLSPDGEEHWQACQPYDIEDEDNPLVVMIKKFIGLTRMVYMPQLRFWELIEEPQSSAMPESFQRYRALYIAAGWDENVWDAVRDVQGVAAKAEAARAKAKSNLDSVALALDRGKWQSWLRTAPDPQLEEWTKEHAAFMTQNMPEGLEDTT